MENIKTVSLYMKELLSDKETCTYQEVNMDGKIIENGRKIKIIKTGDLQQVSSFTGRVGTLLSVDNSVGVDIYQCNNTAILIHHSGEFLHYCECSMLVMFSILAKGLENITSYFSGK